MTRSLAPLALAFSIFGTDAQAQTLFGTGCAGASGVTPALAVSGSVKSGQNWTLEVTAADGVGLGYLLIGFSNTSASALGGQPLPLDLGVFFADPLWSGCGLVVDPNYTILPYTFDPFTNGGLVEFQFGGFDIGTVYMQTVNIDFDIATRIAGVSQGLAVRRIAPTGMVAIDPGTFEMGSNAASGAPYFGDTNSQPVHAVTISYPFWMGQHEVTQAEYAAVMGTNPSYFKLGGDLPVESVKWNDAVEYCAALTVAETLAGNVPVGYEYRLPTEAEWEYCCRAGTTTEFNVGAELFCSDAAIGGTFHSTSNYTDCGDFAGSYFVGSYAPNAWGLYDMHGNVWEWCLDSFGSYSAAPVTDPFVTGGPALIFRGGGWSWSSKSCRSALRFAGSLGTASNTLGFRVVLAPVLVP